MEMKELGAVMEKWAPMLAKQLVGPYSGVVLSILASLYESPNKFDLKALADQIVSNPYKLKELEIQHREKVGDQLVGLLEIVEQRGSNALLWLLGIVFSAVFVAYLIYEVILNG